MTAIAEQMISQGLRPEEVEFYVAITRFLNNGGTIQRGHELLDQNNQRQSRAPITVSPRARAFLAAQDTKPNVTPIQPRPPLAKERVERRERIKQVALFGLKTGDGRDWADVGAHELDSMARDGAMATAIKSRIGVLTNAQRFQKLRDLISIETFNEARQAASP